MFKLHLDRAISVYLCHPLLRGLNGWRQPRIPILMYHSISGQGTGYREQGTGNREQATGDRQQATPDRGHAEFRSSIKDQPRTPNPETRNPNPESRTPWGRHPYYETNTSPQVFAQHMKFLRDNGYRTVSLDEAADLLAGPGTTPRFALPSSFEEGNKGWFRGKPVVITFDDGYLDFYSHAYPILREHSFTATVFVVTSFLKAERAHFNGKGCLTLSEVRELHSKGIEIGSHTVTHPELELLKLDEVDNELTGSKKTLEDAIGAPIKSFSYPYAFPEADRGFVSGLEKILNKCGYRNGVSTIIGTAKHGDNRFFLPRLPMNSYDDFRFFQAKLEGGYDWLHFPQLMYKRVLPTV